MGFLYLYILPQRPSFNAQSTLHDVPSTPEDLPLTPPNEYMSFLDVSSAPSNEDIECKLKIYK